MTMDFDLTPQQAIFSLLAREQLSISELADRIDVAPAVLEGITQYGEPITPSIANSLGRRSRSPEYWMALELLHQARQEIVRLREGVRWMGQSIHQGYHETGTFQTCPKATCSHAADLLRT